ncbi:hypothetical protein [Companilactobacillus pabuli]|jgi:hypothetical protein|uniref:Uncharacterized protein n=1 Tax=Companilactobacillus pabuli TaxID=2714036 RepID=A0A7L7KV76_9LACO|nr:hypothetical protein [Companilactobacillus pabuli]AKP03139.1 hypothetical protein ABB45_05550 [Companilactobacillus farciminis]AKS51439.1 hypothetical protein ABB44_05560 [Companilactobacillus farciminis]MDG5112228.1 hypothetical protein [Companilactobacillus pabuli]QMT83202.1 hypothetical protein G6534_00385 [Companilactobacillus pabuli]GAQ01856.1 hypothetical protein NBRC111452_1671 [Companilactobacillus farciminis]
MNSETISTLADWLYTNRKKIEDKSEKFDAQKVYNILDSLEVLRKPIKEYFDMTEDDYYQNESDHRLTLQNPDQKLSELHDRVQVNHVDGSLEGHDINFTYNHEDPYAEKEYQVKTDINLVNYSFTVIGAVYDNTIVADVRNSISKDAILSIGLAAHAIEEWQ